MAIDTFICGVCNVIYHDFNSFFQHKVDCGKTQEGESSEESNAQVVTTADAEQQGTTEYKLVTIEGDNVNAVTIDGSVIEGGHIILQTGDTPAVPKKKAGRPRKGQEKAPKAGKSTPVPQKLPEVEPDASGKLNCPNCKKTFMRKRHYTSHKCMASSEYVDLTKKESLGSDVEGATDEDEEGGDLSEMTDKSVEFNNSQSVENHCMATAADPNSQGDVAVPQPEDDESHAGQNQNLRTPSEGEFATTKDEGLRNLSEGESAASKEEDLRNLNEGTATQGEDLRNLNEGTATQGEDLRNLSEGAFAATQGLNLSNPREGEFAATQDLNFRNLREGQFPAIQSQALRNLSEGAFATAQGLNLRNPGEGAFTTPGLNWRNPKEGEFAANQGQYLRNPGQGEFSATQSQNLRNPGEGEFATTRCHPNRGIKRKFLNLEERVKVIRLSEGGLACKKICEVMGVGKTQVHGILVKKDEILQQWASGATTSTRKRLTPRRMVYGDLNDKVYQWFLSVKGRNVSVSGRMLQDQASHFAQEMGYDNFSASNGWLRSFQARHGINQGDDAVLAGDTEETSLPEGQVVFPGPHGLMGDNTIGKTMNYGVVLSDQEKYCQSMADVRQPPGSPEEPAEVKQETDQPYVTGKRLPDICKVYSPSDVFNYDQTANIKQETFSDWGEQLPEICKDYSPINVFNCEETGLFFRTLPNGYLVDKGANTSNGELAKERITVLLAASAIGEKLRPLVIGKSVNSTCFSQHKMDQLGVTFESNEKAWLTAELFAAWLQQLNNQMSVESRKILLFMEERDAHPAVELSNVKIVFFPSDTKCKLQPLETGIIQAVKFNYRKKMLRHVAVELEETSTPSDVARSITLLHALEWIRASWNLVRDSTIEKCFRRCGFFQDAAPVRRNTPADHDGLDTEDLEPLLRLLPGATAEDLVYMDEATCTSAPPDQLSSDEEEPEPTAPSSFKKANQDLDGIIALALQHNSVRLQQMASTMKEELQSLNLLKNMQARH